MALLVAHAKKVNVPSSVYYLPERILYIEIKTKSWFCIESSNRNNMILGVRSNGFSRVPAQADTTNHPSKLES